MKERDIQAEIRLAAHELGLVMWRNNVGVTEGPRPVRYGLCVGSSDLIGIIRPEGAFVAIEVKSKRGRTSEEQAMFGSIVRGCGGLFVVARSVDDVRNAIAEWRLHRG